MRPAGVVGAGALPPAGGRPVLVEQLIQPAGVPEPGPHDRGQPPAAGYPVGGSVPGAGQAMRVNAAGYTAALGVR